MHFIIPFLDSLVLLQGIILGIIIILLGKGKHASLFFGFFLITYAAELTDGILMGFNILKEHPKLEFEPFNFYFLNISLLYLFVESIVGKFEWRRHIWWLLPGIFEFTLFLTVLIFFSYLSEEIRHSIIGIRNVLAFIWNVSIAIFIAFKVKGYQKDLDLTHTNPVTSNLRWVIWICYYFIFITVLLNIYSFFALESFKIYALLSTVNVIFVYLVGLRGLRQEYLEISDDNSDQFNDIYYETDGKEKVDRNVSTLSIAHKFDSNRKQNPDEQNESFDKRIFKRIDQKIVEEKLYLDSELNLFKVSRKVGLQSRQLSELIYKMTGNHFKSYINLKRLDCAKIMLLDAEFQDYTMEAIAYDSGFHSKSTFFNLFKLEEACTPNEYRIRQTKKAKNEG